MSGVNNQAVSVERYAGDNEIINRLMTVDENVWIINAHGGRKVLILKPGEGEEEAWATYLERYPQARGKSKSV